MNILFTILVTFFAGMGAGLGTGFAGLNGCTAGVFWYSAEKQEKILPISGVGCTLRFMAEMLYFSCKSAVRQKK